MLTGPHSSKGSGADASSSFWWLLAHWLVLASGIPILYVPDSQTYALFSHHLLFHACVKSPLSLLYKNIVIVRNHTVIVCLGSTQIIWDDCFKMLNQVDLWRPFFLKGIFAGSEKLGPDIFGGLLDFHQYVFFLIFKMVIVSSGILWSLNEILLARHSAQCRIHRVGA